LLAPRHPLSSAAHPRARPYPHFFRPSLRRPR
jgi:hypothetical protein